jgi:hypothetical protein
MTHELGDVRSAPFHALFLQELWIELGNKNKMLQSEQRVLKETQVLYTLHEQFMGV